MGRYLVFGGCAAALFLVLLGFGGCLRHSSTSPGFWDLLELSWAAGHCRLLLGEADAGLNERSPTHVVASP